MGTLTRCIFKATSSGTGDFIQAAAVLGFQTMQAAGAVDGSVYSYAAQSADLTQWEVGIGTWTLATQTLARTTVQFNSLGTTARVNFTAPPPQVLLTLLATDIRTKLTAATTNFYVATTGSDSTGTGSVSAPWATIQHAVDTIAATIDMAGQQVIVNVGAGSFVGLGMRSCFGGGNLLIKGAGSTLTTINAGLNDGVYNLGDAVSHNVQTEVILSVDKVRLTSNLLYGFGIYSSGTQSCIGDNVAFAGADVVFGPAAGNAIGMFSPALLFTVPGSYSINMGVSCAHFMQIANGAQIQIDGTFTCVGTTNFTTAFQTVFGNSSVFWISYSFVNAANFTGIKAHVFGDGYLNTSGVALTSFPGNAAANIELGGAVDADTFIEGVQQFQLGTFTYPPRIVLTANHTWFVSTAGNDTTGDGTVGAPWRTGQKAWNYIAQNVDLAGFVAFVQFANGNYDGVYLSVGNCGEGFVQFQGNKTNKTLVNIGVTGTLGWGFLNLDEVDCIVYLSDLSVTNAINLQGGIHLRIGSLDNTVGNGTLYQFGVGSDFCIRLDGPRVEYQDFGANTTVDFTATATVRGFLDIDTAATAIFQSIAAVNGAAGVTNMTDAFIKANGDSLVQFNKSASQVVSNLTGKRFFIDSGAIIEVFGAGLSAIPGSTAGSVEGGGTYADADPNMYSGISVGWHRATPFAALPPSPADGMTVHISDGLAANCADGTCTTFGTNVTGGGGALKLLVWYNGTNWTLVGK